MEVIQKIKIDLLKPGVKPVVNVMQADENSRVIEISLYANGVAWNVPDGVSFSVAYKKPDGTRGLYETLPNGSSASSVTENVVSIRLAPQMLTFPGDVESSVVISSGEQTISTFPVIVNVIQNPAAGAVGSEDYFYSSVIGNLADLKTNDKSSIVAAINEIFSTGGDSDSGQNGDGLSDNAKALLITILRNGKYISDQSANITALEEALAGSGGEVQPSVYTVKNTLSNVSTNNPAASITGGESYSATLTADDGYVIDYIRVVMGGKDVTNTAYTDGVINIETVTGNLEITAGASAIASSDIMQIGNTLSITGGVTVTQTDTVLNIA